MSDIFYIVAILATIAFPLAVPTSVSIVHAIKNRKPTTAAPRPAVAGAVRPAVTPAFAAAVPAAA